ncbi:GTP-binding protein [Rummeliibacillus sp. NPDC094406]|uniref:GTP-binding protein n=1 Tax=Rummeliibacillus sp. NPDC094406 TaxID=3364511 RepID=UPI0037F2850E
MFKTIGVLAHVDAGKTTFSEQLLYHTNSIKERGRVDHKDAFLDNHAIERERGITVFAEQGRIVIGDDTYTIIDTPGHVDFSPEMERAIQILDYAIVVVSAVDGVEGHTETVWQLLRKYNIPTFIFINKTDREGANVAGVIEEMQQELSQNIISITNQLADHSISDQILEFIAERDEELFEKYMEQDINNQQFLQKFQQLIIKGEVFPCAEGSALKDIGVIEFFEQIMTLTQTNFNSEAPFTAKVFKIRHDDKKQRFTFMKAMTGKLKVRDELHFGEISEKVTEIRLYNGEQYEVVKEVTAGEIFAVTGITQATIGDVIGGTDPEIKQIFELVPTLQSKVVNDGTEHIKDVLANFRLLDAEDPSLHVLWSEKFQEIHVHVMGVIQLEVLVEVVKERFGLQIHFDNPQILYMETIDNSVTGYGHFEPLKHYAEVHLRMEPAKKGTGILFENMCHADDLSVGHQRLIEQHIFEREHHGLLTGFPITDIKFTLVTGRAHIKHTEGGDFREATYRAIRQGLEQAENRLLEPYYTFKMKASSEFVGRMMTDIQQASGEFEAPSIIEEKVIIKGRAPVSTFMNYSTTFAAYTNGKGALSLTFSGYDSCHNTEEVIENIGYNKNADSEYTSSSIFCAKGKGYPVPWDKAEAAMHCLIK